MAAAGEARVSLSPSDSLPLLPLSSLSLLFFFLSFLSALYGMAGGAGGEHVQNQKGGGEQKEMDGGVQKETGVEVYRMGRCTE